MPIKVQLGFNWINAAPIQYKILVANQIAAIQSDQNDWHYVKPQNNLGAIILQYQIIYLLSPNHF